MAQRRSPGSQGALRAANEARIVQALRGAPATQSEIAERTGLAHATVSNIVRDLRERGSVSTEPTVHQGRRASLVTLERAEGPTVVGIDFGRQHVRIAVAADDPIVLVEDEVVLPVGHRAEESLAVAAELLDRLLREADVSRKNVAAICVGVPCPIDLRTGTILGHSILPEWDGVTRDRIGEAFGMAVEVANDSDLGAIAERAFGPYSDVDDLIFVKIGTGIGSGLVIGGKLHRGSFGIAGELGHVQVDPNGTLCVCGSRGCLETLASVRVMAQSLSAAFGRPVTTSDIVHQAIDGDPATRRVVADAGVAIGRTIANACNILAPSVVVVGGPLAEVGDLLLHPVRDGFRRFALHPLATSTQIVGASLGPRAEVLGAVTLARQTARTAAFM
ncbi:ROK family transcriptional regulator [Agrococcus sp. ARC_14]|uniref:ROK family transcriptional regulator n=1 Tax=Agrococcus sp. ARC_14 TaxID=2919927 RepID=UPI001F062E4E|nr:ROK family transcriptional regulator [Agrococcus sp. ARC_14]MCH1882196.1 ROK family transcriptional regulator [Agrococcus sp. ARC_14]